ncbi:MAG: hypothetical protein LBK60_02575 [Verrucomicrobiales bacterium]|nr:hypothetical protein [Verrucomicrobiales bacterium]
MFFNSNASTSFRTISKLGSGDPTTINNTGTIQAFSGTLNINASTNNSGGLLRAGNGGALDFNNSTAVIGGVLHIDANSKLVYNNVQGTLASSGVDFENHGQ